MGMTCTVCSSANREAIDRALIEGKSGRVIARLVGDVSHDAIQRHRQCIREALANGKTRQAGVALDHGLWLVGKLRKLAESAEPHPRRFIEAADALNRSLRTLGALTGEISSGQVTQLFVNLGVRDEAEIRSALALARGGERTTLDDLFAESLEALRFVLTERPELRQTALMSLSSEAHVIESGNGDEP